MERGQNIHINYHGFELISKQTLRQVITVEELERVAPLKCPALNNMTEETIYQQNKCSVCYETFSTKQLHRILPCNHAFHAECVDRWLLLRSSTCPICRYDIIVSN
jgi:hypothetical protein